MSAEGADEAERHSLPRADHAAIFERRIAPALFADAKAQAQPVAVVFGGQPGSGKSAALHMAERELVQRGGSVTISGDELRAFHPRYAELLGSDDKTAAFYTDRDSGRWVEKAIQRGIELRTNLVIEGTMRNPDVVARTLTQLKEAGYTTEARALAVNEDRSWQGVLQRYEAQRSDRGTGRMTERAAHDAAYRNMPGTLERIEDEGLADRVMLVRRGGQVIYDNERGPEGWKAKPQAGAVLQAERQRPMTLEEHREFAEGYEALRAAAVRRGHTGANDRDVEARAIQAGRAFDAAVFVSLGRDQGVRERPGLGWAYAALEAVQERAAGQGMTYEQGKAVEDAARAQIAADLRGGRVPMGAAPEATAGRGVQAQPDPAPKHDGPER